MAVLFNEYQLACCSGLFDPEYYVWANPDVAAEDVDPLLHYLETGATQMRRPCSAFDARRYTDAKASAGESVENPLLHFIESERSTTTASKLSSTAPAIKPDEILFGIDRIGISRDSPERMTVTGWALATQPIQELHATLGGLTIRTRYGMPRADVGRIFTSVPQAAQSGFEFTFEFSPSSTPTHLEVTLTATTRNGTLLRTPVSLDASTSRPGPTSRPPMQIFIEAMYVDAGTVLHVTGWMVSLAPTIVADVFVDEARIGPVELNKPRAELAEMHADYPNAHQSGFEIHLDVAKYLNDAHVLMISAVASNGISRELYLPVNFRKMKLAESTSAQSDRQVDLFCDLLQLTTSGNLLVDGWIVTSAPVEGLALILNGTELGSANIGLERADVGRQYPQYSHAANAGFRFECRGKDLPLGEHNLVFRVRAGGIDSYSSIRVCAISAESASAMDLRSASTEESFKVTIDVPRIADGSAITPIHSDLEIAGWALAWNGIADIQISLDGTRITQAALGIRRRDVQRAFPTWKDSLTSGFWALVPRRALPKGMHSVQVTLRDVQGITVDRQFRIHVEGAPITQGPWSVRHKMAPPEIAWRMQPLIGLPKSPTFFLIVRWQERLSKDQDLWATLRSIRAQVYENWEIGVSAPPRQAVRLRRICESALGEIARKARVLHPGRDDKRLWPSRAKPTHVMYLRPGDVLGCDALLEFAAHAAMSPETDFLYCDDRRTNGRSGEIEPFFKPQWSPDLMLSTNYLGRAWCAAVDVLSRAGLGVRDSQKASDYDVALRLSEAANKIVHVPHILLQTKDETADLAAGLRAVEEAARRRGIPGNVTAGRTDGTYRLQRRISSHPLVSIIVPTCGARGLIRTCLKSLRDLTSYRNFEIICVENIPEDLKHLRDWLSTEVDLVLKYTGPFNWSRANNIGAAASKGAMLLFLNDDVEIVDPAWLDVMVEQAVRPEIGVVGPQLLYPDRRVQHAGMFLSDFGTARHAFRFAAEDDPGYFGLALSQREVACVTGACLMVRRTTFIDVGKFDEAHSIVNNDLDFCLRVWQGNGRVLFTPHTKLIHHEAVSRAGMDDTYDAISFKRKWFTQFASGDPYHSPFLSKDRDDFSPEWEPTQLHSVGHPMFLRDSVRKILVVKLDHIGDCVMALPAIRRLKHHFAAAQIFVLVSPATKSLWSLEPAVHKVLEFEFFHDRSACGLVEHTQEDWQNLRKRLVTYDFDLAIDLRKHWETRPVLLSTGAKYLAGFDMKGKFPWLDLSLEWVEDIPLVSKRSYAGDDLENLVEVICAATRVDRSPIRGPRSKIFATRMKRIPSEIFLKRVVCVHPAVGNDTRRWPAEYFADLIDLLVESEGVNVVIVGGRDDMEVAQTVMDSIVNRDSVWSLAGLLSLSELPWLMLRCNLFVGNNSGPHHIAAGLGVPTIGIHSGVVDSAEWGPKGTNAVAIRRAMSCSPCYISRVEECNRRLACLRGLRAEHVARACHRALAPMALT